MTDLDDLPRLLEPHPTDTGDVAPPAAAGAQVRPGDGPPVPARVRLPTAEPGARRRRLHVPRGLERLAAVAALLALWELAAQLGWISPTVLAGPSSVATVARDLFSDGTLQDHLWASFQRVLWGLGIGIPVGAVLALIAGSGRLGDDVVDANMQMLRFVPVLALQPLFIVWLGVGESVKITLLVIGVAFPIYVNTSSAIKGLDPRYRELARVVGADRRTLIRRVVLPGALPGFLVGLRMATGIAWLLLFFAEQINATSGIGFMMTRAQVLQQTDVIVLGLLAYAALGLLCDGLVRALERRLLRWQPGR